MIHSHPVWLPQTQTWMYNQVKYLPKMIESHIVCERTQNLDQFTVPHIHSLHQAARWRYYWDKGLRRLRVRRHLGFLTAQIKKHQVQVVHSHFGNIGWADLRAVKKAGVTGLLAQERDVDGLVKHLLWLVKNPEKWQDMLQAGRKQIETKFDARVQGEKLAGVYGKIGL